MIYRPVPGICTQFFGENPNNEDYSYDELGHKGIDLRAGIGEFVKAGLVGVTRYVDHGKIGFGKHIWIDCGYMTLSAPGISMYGHVQLIYGHLSGGYGGKRVAPGDLIGLAGNTGNSSAAHLHFEVRVDGVPIDPLPFLERPSMSSKYGFQTQIPQYAPWLVGHVARSRAEWAKILDPDYGIDAPFGPTVKYIGRFYFGRYEPDKECMWRGAAGADEYWAMLKPRLDKCPWLYAFEGPNEPAVDSIAKARLCADFYERLCMHAHQANKRIIVGVFSTGCPALALWPYLQRGLKHGDFLAFHEYGMKRMTLDGDHLLRYRQVLSWSKATQQPLPLFMITETGIDFAGGHDDGWKCQGITPEQYLAQLIPYDLCAQQDPEVVCVLPFAWSTNKDWENFEFDENMSRLYTNYLQEVNGMSLDIHIGNEGQQYIIPFNPASAFGRAGLAKGYIAVSGERDTMWGGQRYRYQIFRDPKDVKGEWQHFVYCLIGDWGNLIWFKRLN